MAATFNVSPSSAVGNVFLTEFTFQSTVSSAISYSWDFGDNSTSSYEGPTVAHIYRYPGTYTVSSSAWSNDDSAPIVSQQTLSASYVYSNSVTFTQYPSAYSNPGEKTSSPFVVSLTCTEIKDSLYLALQALNTSSTPIAHVPPKWQGITPKWQFIDATSNKVVTDGLLVNTAPIYQTYNGVEHIVAVSGTASFYYVDDLPTRFDLGSQAPILLIATLSTQNFVYPPDSQIYDYNSYANSDAAKAATLWQVNDCFPTSLKVTENFISDVYPIKWTGVPIPTMITPMFDSRLNKNYTGVPVTTANVLGYPATNSTGSVFPVTLSLSNNTTFAVETTANYFSNTDSLNNTNSGYIYTSITPLISTATPTTIVASTTCIEPLAVQDTSGFIFPYGYPVYSNAYVYSPYNSALNKVVLVNNPVTNTYIQYYKDIGALSDGTLNVWSLPTPRLTETHTPQTTSSAPTYGISFDPILNTIYLCDPLSGTITGFDQSGNIITDSVNFSYISNGLQTASPCNVSVDGEHNLWVSLYNEETILKLDSNFNLLAQVTPSTYNQNISLRVPPIVETDLTNNVWACYAEISASRLVYFNLSGAELQNILLPNGAIPVSLAVDANNTVWVACYNSNQILNISSDGTIVNTLQGDFTRPNHLAFDRSNNVWFTHGYDFISKFNPTARALDTWEFDVLNSFAYYTPESAPVMYYPGDPQPFDMWSGLTIDVYDRGWAIDSRTNNIVAFHSANPANTVNGINVRNFSIQPAISGLVDIPFSIPSDGIDIPTSQIHSSQANGDWTGNRWYQKYAEPVYVVPVSGVSTSFDVYNLNGSFSVAKVNEEFDISAYFQSLALPESLSQNDAFFKEFLSAVAGDGNPTKESAGRVIYERIANFVQTHGDFETAEIDQLLSYANQLSVDAKTYGIDFPVEINRLLNLFSIPKNELRGRINYDPNPNNNIGPILTQTDFVSAGQYLFARDIKYLNYQLVYVTPLDDGTEVYPLSSLNVGGFTTPLKDNYYFFQFVQNKLGYTENIINWDSMYTTFDYTLSSNTDWYGDNGLIEKMFNNILTKNLTE